MSKDRFSQHSHQYARYRPAYPDLLFANLADLVPARTLVWDCACGTGQVSLPLTTYFERVVATDLSAAQLHSAQIGDNLYYVAALAEAAPLAAESVDLVAVGQALHWFAVDAFFAECRRVLKPGGVLAVLTYNLLEVSPAVDAFIHHFYHDVLGAYWDQERRLVEEGYRSIEFPFDTINVPDYSMERYWTQEQLLGYLSTWSAVKRYRQARGSDPLAELSAQLASIWPGGRALVRWPLTTIVRRKAA